MQGAAPARVPGSFLPVPALGRLAPEKEPPPERVPGYFPSADELCETWDWLVARQEQMEAALAGRHLQEGGLVLYDVTSVVYEGKRCPLVRWGHSRDGRGGKLQLLLGVVTNGEGCPVAMGVLDGKTEDLAPQVSRVRQRFGLERFVVAGGRGQLTEARLGEELLPAHLDWIPSLRSPQLR